MTSILQFSDVHFGVEDRDAMAAIKAYCETLEPDVALLCGDITQDGKIEEFRAAADWIASFDVPMLIVPGNHDTPVFGIFDRLFRPWARYDRYIRPLSVDQYEDEHVVITGMNTARGVQAKLDWSLGVVDLDELDSKIAILRRPGPKKVSMLALHHPLIYPDISPLDKETERGPQALHRLSDAGIDAVLSGHIHAPFFTDRDPGRTEIVSIGSGTLSTRMRGVPASFNHIKIDAEFLSVTAIDWIDDTFVPAKPWLKSRASLNPMHVAT